jgi:hypothetical protein
MERSGQVTRLLRQAFRIFALGAVAIPAICFAQLFPVAPIDKGVFGSSDSTMTFLYAAAAAKATLVLIPGGDGSVGVKPDWDASHPYFARYYFNRMLQRLSDPSATSGNLNVVIFDSPISLGDAGWPAARATSDHLTRIESVVRFYKEKLGKPVWVMGHSNGGVSVTEFYKYLQKNKNENLIAGIVYSAGRDGSSFDNDTGIPVLLMHHEKDGCANTTPYHTERLFNKLREAGNSFAEFVLIKTGEAGPKDACHSGYHMYFRAGAEVAKVIDQFMAKYTTVH